MVFVTKYRHPVFSDTYLERMGEIMRAVCRDFGCELVEFNGEAEHVHLLVRFPPTVTLSRLVNSLKGVTSRRLRQEFPELARHYWRAKRLWSGSYFAGSVGRCPAGRAPRLHRAAEPASRRGSPPPEGRGTPARSRQREAPP